MSPCLCTGECEELGYCPNTTYPRWKRQPRDPVGDPPWEENPYIETTTTDWDFDIPSPTPEINEGDEIWFKRSDGNRIFHKFVDTVKDNVFRTVDKEEHIGDTYTGDTWWEFANVRIIEVEHGDN